jgi:hypothetical protein
MYSLRIRGKASPPKSPEGGLPDKSRPYKFLDMKVVGSAIGFDRNVLATDYYPEVGFNQSSGGVQNLQVYKTIPLPLILYCGTQLQNGH